MHTEHDPARWVFVAGICLPVALVALDRVLKAAARVTAATSSLIGGRR